MSQNTLPYFERRDRDFWREFSMFPYENARAQISPSRVCVHTLPCLAETCHRRRATSREVYIPLGLESSTVVHDDSPVLYTAEFSPLAANCPWTARQHTAWDGRVCEYATRGYCAPAR